MFIKLHGVLGQRLIFNIDHISGFQEITEGSKYASSLAHGGKTCVQLGDQMVPVKNTIIQIENMLKKAEQIGGAK